MTKYSKIKKSSFAILALSLILVAVLAFGGTYAYFNDSVTADGGSVTTATLVLTDTVAITAATDDLVPNQTIDIELGNVELSGTTLSAVRFKLSALTLTGGASATLTEEQKGYLVLSAEASDLTGNKGWEAGSDGYFYYKDFVKTLDVDGSLDVSIALNKLAGNEWQGITATFSITFEAMQAEYYESNGATPTYSLSAAEALWA